MYTYTYIQYIHIWFLFIKTWKWSMKHPWTLEHGHGLYIFIKPLIYPFRSVNPIGYVITYA